MELHQQTPPETDTEAGASENDRERTRARDMSLRQKEADVFAKMTGGSRQAAIAARLTIQALSREYQVSIAREILSIFLTRDGTVITFLRTPRPVTPTSSWCNGSVVDPIFERLQEEDSMLRASCDPALLVHGLLDIVVDYALEVGAEFEDQILALESGVLVSPQMEQVRHRKSSYP